MPRNDGGLAAQVALKTGYNIDAVRNVLDAAGELQARRIDELLAANNAELERRRAAEQKAEDLRLQLEAVTRALREKGGEDAV